MGRQRDLLPCPPPLAAQFVAEQLPGSRACKRRLQRKVHWQRWCNEGVAALNSMFGRGEPVYNTEINAAQSIALDEVVRCYRRVGPPPSDLPSPAGAFAELCGSKAGYTSTVSGDLGKPVPFEAGCVSLPPRCAVPADVEQLLDGRALCMWRDWREHLLRAPNDVAGDDAAFQRESVYNDKSLTARPKLYAKFVEELVARGVVELGAKRDASIGLFFVGKKPTEGSGQLAQRLIFDTRYVNSLFKPPAKTVLPSSAAWSRVESCKDTSPLHLVHSDVQAAFYRIALPEGLADYFILPPVSRRFLSADLQQQLSELGDTVSPQMRTLPMGWAWAVFSAKLPSRRPFGLRRCQARTPSWIAVAEC